MQEPFDPPPTPPADDAKKPAGAELTLDESGVGELTPPGRSPTDATEVAASQAPLREIAHAFRLNAEALHTLKEMQGDLARQVRRGDRSELVVQSTQSLNETFRNLTSVQQELLRKIHTGEEKRGAGPLVPLMLLGLLVVLIGGIWIVLDELQQQKVVDPELAPAEVVRRERDAWKQGRNEGASQMDNEVRRLQQALGEAKSRTAVLQADIDKKIERIAVLDQGKRTTEIERDEFAGQVRRAQSEMMAKKLLEEEVGTLKLQLEAAERLSSKAEHELDLQRRKSAYLRERMADYGMGFSDDDPAWRPGQPAGSRPDGADEVVRKPSKLTNLELIKRKLDAMGGVPPAGAPGQPAATVGSASDGAERGASTVPPPAYGAGAPKPSRGAAYGGDRPGELPPAILVGRKTSRQPATASVERVRGHLNALLQQGDSRSGAGWRITRVSELAADRLGGVVMVRYDAGGQMVETVEAREVRIAVDRSRKQVEFAFRDGMRLAAGQRMNLPAAGSRVVVAEGAEAAPWNSSSLRVIQKR